MFQIVFDREKWQAHYNAVECELAFVQQGTMAFSIFKTCFSDFLSTFFEKQTRALSLQRRWKPYFQSSGQAHVTKF